MGEFVNHMIENFNDNMEQPLFFGLVILIILLISSKIDYEQKDITSYGYYYGYKYKKINLNSRYMKLIIVFLFSFISILIFSVNCSVLLITALRIVAFVFLQTYIMDSIGLGRSIILVAGSVGAWLCLRHFVCGIQIGDWYSDNIVVVVSYIVIWLMYCSISIFFYYKGIAFCFISLFLLISDVYFYMFVVVKIIVPVASTRTTLFAAYYTNESCWFLAVTIVSTITGVLFVVGLENLIENRFVMSEDKVTELFKLQEAFTRAITNRIDLFGFTYKVFYIDEYEKVKNDILLKSNSNKDDSDSKITSCDSNKEREQLTEAIKHYSEI